MKRLLSVAIMVLVSLVGMVGFSRAAELQNIQKSMCAVIECIEVSALQATTNPTTGALTELLEPVNDGVQVKPKMYYLTKNSFEGGDAITACDSGFHMASISEIEIQDSSNLQYVNRSTTVYDSLVDDQGLGSPSGHMGWVRSGVSSDEFPDPFSRSDDCNLWTVRSRAFSGSTAQLLSTWDVLDTCPVPCKRWIPSTSTCESYVRVWCVEDPA